jgi:hypothetical protein
VYILGPTLGGSKIDSRGSKLELVLVFDCFLVESILPLKFIVKLEYGFLGTLLYMTATASGKKRRL